ncbi:hydrogenase maturation nickel metallochaperone HypA/HybF [Deinococcus sedimenti]|uniref:Hydrogenase maturation factor HypA n=1 Tax=Deinococcus sedimenti TaxID=1867090 RepID=A0ABQ2S384_9DEIO|nr:hydrogenase maturation nickel metallochaperone HypA [Deinococcus sedimenti]GGR93565.1 hypothetical protein GCM10008960_20690 [Deinococcus sedimenti]
MHEASVALALVDVATEALHEHGGARVTALTVRVGAWSSVVPEALMAAFPACAAGTPLQGARLTVVRVPGVGDCPAHGPVELDLTRGLRCPSCGAAVPALVQGDELELDELELGDPELGELALGRQGRPEPDPAGPERTALPDSETPGQEDV